MDLRKIVYAFACLSFAIVIGAAVYEHVAVVPQWTAAPPLSLSMFQGKYGLNPTPFWKAIHPVTLLLLSSSLILFWRTGSRPYLLTTGIGYVLVLIITFAFFVPELIAITGSGYASQSDSSLVQRASLWEALSLVRLAFLILLAIVGLLGLTKQDIVVRSAD